MTVPSGRGRAVKNRQRQMGGEVAKIPPAGGAAVTLAREEALSLVPRRDEGPVILIFPPVVVLVWLPALQQSPWRLL